ncbi:MAG: tetratricopeptide repeat protein [Anaerolineae bacterium]
MTLRDKLEQRQAALFTNREFELNEMERLLNTPSLPYNFLHISGIGGVGKSSLVQALARRCSARGVPLALADARIPRTAIEILAAFQSQLRVWGEFTEFERALRKYLNIQGKLQKSSDVPDQIIQLATKGITLVSQVHPLSSLAIQMVGPESVEAALKLLHQVLTKEETDFYLNAVDALTQQFAHSLKELADRERTVLVFDSFERMADLSPWLADHVANQLPENVLVVLSGRESLGSEWEQWRPLIRELPLTPFTPADVETYLRKRGMCDDKLISGISTFTGGIPLGVATLADLNDRRTILATDGLLTNARFDAIDLLIDRIVGCETQKDLRATLEACAVLRTFDEDVLAFMLQRDEAVELYRELRGLSFVQTYEGRAGLHDVVRDMLREQFRHYAPDRFAEANRRAADFYTQRLSQRRPDRWEVYLIEKLYHLLAAAPDEGFDFFARVYGEAERVYRLGLCTALLAEIRQATLSPEQTRWVKFYEGKVLFMQNQWKKAEAIYEQLASAATADLVFRTVALVEWGRTAAQLGQWDTAVSRCQKALAVWRKSGEVVGEAQTLLHLANAYRLQGNWGEAQSSAEASLAMWEKLDRQYEMAYALNLLGDIHRVQGHWSDAEECYHNCLAHRRKSGDQHGIGQTLRNLGDVYRHQTRWSEATKCYQESLAIQRQVNDDYEIGRLLHSMGAIALAQNNPREALRHFSLSLKVRRSLGDQYRVARTLRSMGKAYTALGDHELAIATLKEARQSLEAMGDEFGVGFTDDWLGMAWQAKGDVAQAQNAFESSIAIMRRNGNRYYEARALTHLLELGQQTRDDVLVLRYEPDVAALAGTPGIDNRLATMYGALAEAYLRLNDTERAVEYQRRADEARQRFEATRGHVP